jgi:MoaA/NifB/PqqE/SkfB family radical SAM enzyme
MTLVAETEVGERISPRLWIYTNFDCNLQCTYCVAKSHPRAERRGLGLIQFQRLIDEAAEYGVEQVFLTGGEPFLLPDIGEKIRYAAGRLPTTVLTNAMLFRGRKLEILHGLVGTPNLVFQVSLDAGSPQAHNAYRGPNAWEKGVEGIRLLQSLGFTVAIGSTETPANTGEIDALRAFVAALGIPEERHFIRPLAARGYSAEGIAVTAADLEPEITASLDGIFWHPLACEDDLLVTRRLFPFREAMAQLESMYAEVLKSGAAPQRFR